MKDTSSSSSSRQCQPTHHNYAWPLVSWDVICLNSSEALSYLHWYPWILLKNFLSGFEILDWILKYIWRELDQFVQDVGEEEEGLILLPPLSHITKPRRELWDCSIWMKLVIKVTSTGSDALMDVGVLGVFLRFYRSQLARIDPVLRYWSH